MRFTLTEQNYHDLFENASDAMWVQDLEGNFVVANKACEALTGFTRNELLAKQVNEFLVPDSLQRARAIGRSLLRGEDFAQPYDQWVVRKNGSVRALKMTTSLVVIDGVPAGFQHVARDVTEEQIMTEMLSEITNGSPIPTFVIDREHRITHWNTALVSLTGLHPEEMLGTDRQWSAFYPQQRPTLADMIVDGAPPSEIEVYYHDEFKESSLMEGAYEAEGFRPSVGETGRWLHFTASPIKNASGDVVAALEALQDISGEKRMQENMRYYVQLITRAQEEERKRLARDLHDDISSSLLLLIRRLDAAIPTGKTRLSASHKATLEDLHRQAVESLEHVRRYVQDLRPRILDDLGLVASLEWMADDLQKRHSIRASVSVTGAERILPTEVQLLLFRIAQEAINNVRRHARATAVEICLDLGAAAITMTVRDNGLGFHVPSRIEDLAGTGHLGIMGMAERAKLLSGTLEVHSSPGNGTEIVTGVPLKFYSAELLPANLRQPYSEVDHDH
jgi:PAS domain S-box-containing protein